VKRLYLKPAIALSITGLEEATTKLIQQRDMPRVLFVNSTKEAEEANRLLNSAASESPSELPSIVEIEVWEGLSEDSWILFGDTHLVLSGV